MHIAILSRSGLSWIRRTVFCLLFSYLAIAGRSSLANPVPIVAHESNRSAVTLVWLDLGFSAAPNIEGDRPWQLLDASRPFAGYRYTNNRNVPGILTLASASRLAKDGWDPSIAYLAELLEPVILDYDLTFRNGGPRSTSGPDPLMGELAGQPTDTSQGADAGGAPNFNGIGGAPLLQSANVTEGLPIQPTPLPGSLALVSSAIAGFGLLRWRRRQRLTDNDRD
jgi:hypothetical protein